MSTPYDDSKERELFQEIEEVSQNLSKARFARVDVSTITEYLSKLKKLVTSYNQQFADFTAPIDIKDYE